MEGGRGRLKEWEGGKDGGEGEETSAHQHSQVQPTQECNVSERSSEKVTISIPHTISTTCNIKIYFT